MRTRYVIKQLEVRETVRVGAGSRKVRELVAFVMIVLVHLRRQSRFPGMRKWRRHRTNWSSMANTHINSKMLLRI